MTGILRVFLDRILGMVLGALGVDSSGDFGSGIQQRLRGSLIKITQQLTAALAEDDGEFWACSGDCRR